MSNNIKIQPSDLLRLHISMQPSMFSNFWPIGGTPGILHHYTESLVTFEYTSQTSCQPHSVVFVGGLSDGLATSSFTADVVQAMQPTQWSFFTLTLSSSYQAWGLGHLDRDTEEVAKCIRYIQEYKTAKFGSPGKIVLWGHSTGSQCVLHYLYKPNPHVSTPSFDPDLEHEERPRLDGAIMQAPVSDREAIWSVLDEGIGDYSPEQCHEAYDTLIALARQATEGEKKPKLDTMLPLDLTTRLGFSSDTPISCRRFLSLASPDSPASPTEDDLFSADLSDAQLAATFGGIKQRGLLRHKLMVAPSGADQSVPSYIDKDRNLVRWRDATDHHGELEMWDTKHSGVIPGASHALSNDDQAEPRRILVERALGFLRTMDRFAD